MGDFFEKFLLVSPLRFIPFNFFNIFSISIAPVFLSVNLNHLFIFLCFYAFCSTCFLIIIWEPKFTVFDCNKLLRFKNFPLSFTFNLRLPGHSIWAVLIFREKFYTMLYGQPLLKENSSIRPFFLIKFSSPFKK